MNAVVEKSNHKEPAQLLFDRLSTFKVVGLSPRSRAIQSEALGLLRGIINGNITTGQQRLNDNLIEIYVDLERAPQNDSTVEKFNLLSEMIQMAAEKGLSVQGLSLTQTFLTRARHRSIPKEGSNL